MPGFIVAASVSAFFFGLFGIDWESIDRKIEDEFPMVDFISTDSLQGLYAQRILDFPVIVDVREAEEFRISHLPEALHLETSEEVAAQIPDRATPIIVYCSVGYRSAAVAARLEELGYTNVRNLRHSIFEWANKDLPMVNASGDTDRVHPFNRVWGSLVAEPLRQYP